MASAKERVCADDSCPHIEASLGALLSGTVRHLSLRDLTLLADPTKRLVEEAARGQMVDEAIPFAKEGDYTQKG